jgi:hypothetical protein
MNNSELKTILFTNARDENNILEWIIHHLNLGFSHIYIFDHKSILPIKLITSKISANFLTIHRLDNNIVKTDLMLKAHMIALRSNYDWMLYLDCDEFLVLNKNGFVNGFLKKYLEYDQVGINWLFFGSNNLDKDTNGTIIESYTKSDEFLNQHIKTFLNLKNKNTHYIKLKNPHVYLLNNMNKSINVKYELLDKNEPHFNKFINQSYKDIDAYVAHYLYQSYETYIKRKIKLPRDDNNMFRDLIQKETFHLLHNTIENFLIKQKYNEKNKLLLDKYKN